MQILRDGDYKIIIGDRAIDQIDLELLLKLYKFNILRVYKK